MHMLDIVACPECRGSLCAAPGHLVCTECARKFEVVDFVPALLPDAFGEVKHEGQLDVWRGYLPWVQGILDGLAKDHLVLDVGSGNRLVEDPRIVRMDVIATPLVDVIGDAHALPFRDGVFDFIYATAVFEHLRQPFEAAREMWRVLKPGGNVLVDCNFVFPFHGYPAVYFNASAEGLRELFAGYTEVGVGVAPWQMPSFALNAVLGEYLRLLGPVSGGAREIVEAIEGVRALPLQDLDAFFSQAAAARVAAAVTFMGIKQPEGGETVVPPSVLEVWRRDPALRARYPEPGALASFEEAHRSGRADSLLHWAQSEGRSRHHQIAEDLDRRVPFEKVWPWGTRSLSPDEHRVQPHTYE